MKKRRRNNIVVDEMGLCNKYDAACAERMSHAMQACADEIVPNYRDRRHQCSSEHEPRKCQESVDRDIRDRITECVGG